MLDTLKGMKSLIFSAFLLSNRQKRKLRIVYLEDFNWVSSANYLGITPASLGAGMELAESQIRSDYQKAASEIRRVLDEYLSEHSEHVPYSYELREHNRLEYIEELLVDDPEMLLLVSNYSSVSSTAGGAVHYPNILDKVACPVLVVPDDQTFDSFGNLLYATALHREDIDAIGSLVELFGDAVAPKLTVFHHHPDDDFEHQMKWLGFQAMVTEAVPQVTPQFHLAKGKDLDAELEDFVRGGDFDLLAALKERKGFFADLFGSSHTHELIRHFNKPVLVYHEKQNE
ncbi:nucleotide-binding universal stress UspA family protein [Mangrovibacterium marinum]|uniref:Nucleotide-binding universal stress UspA family protein n=2 Tax=Mangrovibacterium marinum TaxID=1639118 RepID=A0A2T5BXV0_9BACT|nr:nucleotide-binding universal stress UspA family protein [Mangrovibacterium marinum]